MTMFHIFIVVVKYIKATYLFITTVMLFVGIGKILFNGELNQWRVIT